MISTREPKPLTVETRYSPGVTMPQYVHRDDPNNVQMYGKLLYSSVDFRFTIFQNVSLNCCTDPSIIEKENYILYLSFVTSSEMRERELTLVRGRRVRRLHFLRQTKVTSYVWLSSYGIQCTGTCMRAHSCRDISTRMKKGCFTYDSDIETWLRHFWKEEAVKEKKEMRMRKRDGYDEAT